MPFALRKVYRANISPSCTAYSLVPCEPPSSADEHGNSVEHWASHAYVTTPAGISRPINGQSRGRCASCAGRRACRAAQGHPRKKRGRRTWAAFSLVTFSLAAQEKVTSTRAAPGGSRRIRPPRRERRGARDERRQGLLHDRAGSIILGRHQGPYRAKPRHRAGGFRRRAVQSHGRAGEGASAFRRQAD